MNGEELAGFAPWKFSDYERIVGHLQRQGYMWYGSGSDDNSEEWCRSLLTGPFEDNLKKVKIIDLGCGYARLLNFLLLSSLKQFSYYGIEIPGPKTDVLINTSRKLYDHFNGPDKKIEFGFTNDSEFIDRAIEECNTLILGSIFTHLAVEDSIDIIKRYEKILDKKNGSIIFSLIMGSEYRLFQPNTYNTEGDENPIAYGVTYYTRDQLNALTLAGCKVTKVTDFLAGQNMPHTIYKLQHESL